MSDVLPSNRLEVKSVDGHVVFIDWMAPKGLTVESTPVSLDASDGLFVGLSDEVFEALAEALADVGVGISIVRELSAACSAARASAFLSALSCTTNPPPILVPTSAATMVIDMAIVNQYLRRLWAKNFFHMSGGTCMWGA
jgi:hypothetical protein